MSSPGCRRQTGMTDTTTPTRHGSAVITLPSDTDYLITRSFDAPADAVFDAVTDPGLVQRWWGFESSEWLACDADLRIGGGWRYCTRDEGFEVGFHGVYRDLQRPTRIVSTEAYEGIPDPDGSATVNTVTLDEADGVTTMRVLVQHPTHDDREAVFASGMEGGMQVSYDRLEDLLRTEA